MFLKSQYADSDHTSILATLDNGDDIYIPADPANRHCRLLQTNLIEIAEYVAPKAKPARLPKLLVLERLQAAGKFDVAHAALTGDPYLYQRWLASVSVDPQDIDVQKLLEAVGADPDVILAQE